MPKPMFPHNKEPQILEFMQAQNVHCLLCESSISLPFQYDEMEYKTQTDSAVIMSKAYGEKTLQNLK